MVKNVLDACIRKDTALVILGWLAFVSSFLYQELWWVIPLQIVARVLP